MFGAASSRHPPRHSHGVWLDGSGVLTYGGYSFLVMVFDQVEEGLDAFGSLDDALVFLLPGSGRPWYCPSWSWFLIKWYGT